MMNHNATASSSETEDEDEDDEFYTNHFPTVAVASLSSIMADICRNLKMR